MECFNCYGQKFVVDGLAPLDFSHICNYIGVSPCSLKDGDETRSLFEFKEQASVYTLRQATYPTVESQPLELLAEIFRWRVMELVAQSHPELIFLRGEVVQWGGGGGMLLVGPRLSGKGRLAEELSENGGLRWSSGTAVVREDGTFCPYPAEEMPGQSLRIDIIGSLRFVPGGARLPEPLSVGMATLAMMPSILVPPEDMSTVIPLLGKVASGAKFRYGGTRGEAAETVEFLKREFSAV